MSGYILESGGMIEQNRYVELQKRLQFIGHDRRRIGLPRTIIRRDNIDLCETQIMEMFWDASPIFGNAIHEQMQYLGHRLHASRKALRRLRDKGILCLDGRSYRMLDLDPDRPLEVGAPIVFLAGSRSQKVGTIVAHKELKTGAGGTHPIALLESGQTMFVSPQTAKVDLTQQSLNDHLDWLKGILKNAIDKEASVSSPEICRMAFVDGIPNASKLISIAVKDGLICRGYRRFGLNNQVVYWKNL